MYNSDSRWCFALTAESRHDRAERM